MNSSGHLLSPNKDEEGRRNHWEGNAASTRYRHQADMAEAAAHTTGAGDGANNQYSRRYDPMHEGGANVRAGTASRLTGKPPTAGGSAPASHNTSYASTLSGVSAIAVPAEDEYSGRGQQQTKPSTQQRQPRREMVDRHDPEEYSPPRSAHPRAQAPVPTVPKKERMTKPPVPTTGAKGGGGTPSRDNSGLQRTRAGSPSPAMNRQPRVGQQRLLSGSAKDNRRLLVLNAELRSTLKEVGKKFDDLTAAAQRMEREYADQQQVLKENDVTMERMNELKATVLDARSQIDNSHGELEDYTRAEASLSSAVQAARLERDALQRTLAEMEKQISTEQEKVKSVQAVMTKHTEEIDEMALENEKSDDVIMACERKTVASRDRLRVVAEKHQEAAEEVEKLEAEVDGLHAAMAKLDRDQEDILNVIQKTTETSAAVSPSPYGIHGGGSHHGNTASNLPPTLAAVDAAGHKGLGSHRVVATGRTEEDIQALLSWMKTEQDTINRALVTQNELFESAKSLAASFAPPPV